MAEIGWKGRVKVLTSIIEIGTGVLVLASMLVSAEEGSTPDFSSNNWTNQQVDSNYFIRVTRFLSQKSSFLYQHDWPEMKFGWKIVVGTIVGFFGAAFGTVGGVGGGGIFVPMLTLIIGFDAKSSTAMSKCMIMGASAATVCYNLRQRHPTLDLPIIDYDLALLFQPMLVLGISIGVALNVVLANWMVTVLLIILFIGISTKAFFKGIETWKKETIIKKEAAARLASNGNGGEEVERKTLPEGHNNDTQMESKESKTSKNVYWKELGILVGVWVIILALEIGKNYTATCSTAYWVLNFFQIPVAVGASAYEAVSLYKGRRVIASKGDVETNLKVHRLVLYCCSGILAGVVGGLLGLGGGFIMSPLFLELGIPPQVSSATATFVMMFSSSMSVVEYYLLKRFPIPYALYFIAVATIAAFVGQHVVGKTINILGRASLIIFVLAGTIFVSAISLGGVGISRMIERLERKEYMGFESICAYGA
ncbi:hypothetical protein F0562_022945 [Nyssa sinensis]|uniref:Sulfite exporter TauE/SafE family protein 3-like n=1 Tax=Nyssa sinensis TaxID=561372 RepID=A0A5J5BF70_9ASTE|nr:hypothetical protein F0562_022945 [Nyssa sinensis]